MKPPVVRNVTSYIDWLPAGPDAGRTEGEAILAVAPSGRDGFLAERPQLLNWHAVTYLLALSREQLPAAPGQALEITALPARHAGRRWLTPGTEVGHDMQRILIWLARAEALRATGDPEGALQACEQGLVAAGAPLFALERAMVRQAMAMALHDLGRHLEALRMIEKDVSVFQAHNDIAGALTSLLSLATIDFALGRCTRARETLTQALPLARDLEDEPRLTRIHEQLALCTELLGGGGGAASAG